MQIAGSWIFLLYFQPTYEELKRDMLIQPIECVFHFQPTYEELKRRSFDTLLTE